MLFLSSQRPRQPTPSESMFQGVPESRSKAHKFLPTFDLLSGNHAKPTFRPTFVLLELSVGLRGLQEDKGNIILTRALPNLIQEGLSAEPIVLTRSFLHDNTLS